MFLDVRVDLIYDIAEMRNSIPVYARGSVGKYKVAETATMLI
ncbi:hypothetical protein SAMN05192563_104928 [Paraburkholderia aspalathi]|uniref:Uncharacterized protein n=1 Tax=Paraburkholderia aspalathi TaxID=1324617 RepID=A0A1I7EQK6_9BURK|nr:hypothetical protein SAMN05192563_104928 [Paraburkholderia aspalathi]